MMQESQDNVNPKSLKSDKTFRLKSLDIYQKVSEDFRVQTSSGALLSVIGWIIIVFLAFAEIGNYMHPRVSEHMRVDSTALGAQLQVNINITFHALTCNEVHLDVMDIAGDNQLNVEHDMLKQRLSKEGRHIGRAGVEIIGEGPLDVPDLPKDFCGSCYGAETEIRKCCNTCDELVKAYQDKDWSAAAIIKNSTQCIHDRARHFAEVNPGEGCTVSGTMRVNKVSGNFHIAHGESIVRDGRHIHHFNPVLAPKFNVSHTINSLSFGAPYPYQHNPLDKVKRVIASDGSTGLFQYFVRIIPTIYRDAFGRQIVSSQYTVADRFRPLVVPKLEDADKPVEAILPGIFFVYEISPFMIEASGQSMTLGHLLTKLCAIVGGVLAVSGVVDTLFFNLHRWMNGKK